MRHRNSSELGRGDRRTDAGHHLERDAGHRERERFLGAAAEHERIAALEADHAARHPRALLPFWGLGIGIWGFGFSGGGAHTTPRKVGDAVIPRPPAVRATHAALRPTLAATHRSRAEGTRRALRAGDPPARA